MSYTTDLNGKEETVRNAIIDRMCISFYYQNHRRIAEPHVLGIHKGKKQILIYQIQGTSSSGKLGWKRLDLNGLTSLEMLPESFNGPRKTKSGLHQPWDKKLCEVKQKTTS